MANQANVYIRNLSTDEIRATRILPHGDIDLEIVIDSGLEEQIYLGDTDMKLLINVTHIVDTKICPMTIRSDIDIAVLYSRTDSNWTMQILPNDLPPDIPITLNVTIGAEGP